MIQIVKCHTCGKHKEWKVGEKPPKWYNGRVKDWLIISPQEHNIMRNVVYCSKKCKSV